MANSIISEYNGFNDDLTYAHGPLSNIGMCTPSFVVATLIHSSPWLASSLSDFAYILCLSYKTF